MFRESRRERRQRILFSRSRECVVRARRRYIHAVHTKLSRRRQLYCTERVDNHHHHHHRIAFSQEATRSFLIVAFSSRLGNARWFHTRLMIYEGMYGRSSVWGGFHFVHGSDVEGARTRASERDRKLRVDG